MKDKSFKQGKIFKNNKIKIKNKIKKEYSVFSNIKDTLIPQAFFNLKEGMTFEPFQPASEPSMRTACSHYQNLAIIQNQDLQLSLEPNMCATYSHH